MDIQHIIKKRREELGLTYEEIGNIVGVSKSTVRKWETGMIENMRHDKIALLAQALKVSPGYLMGWEDDGNRPLEDETEIKVIAAHAIDDLTEEEQQEIIKYAKFIKSQRSQNK